MKAGVIDEMMSDAIDGAIDDEEMEDETDAEVDKVSLCTLVLQVCLSFSQLILNASGLCASLRRSQCKLVTKLSGRGRLRGWASCDAACQPKQQLEKFVAWLQVLMEIAGETMAQMAAAPTQRREQLAAVAAEEDTELDDDLHARLQAVRS